MSDADCTPGGEPRSVAASYRRHCVEENWKCFTVDGRSDTSAATYRPVNGVRN